MTPEQKRIVELALIEARESREIYSLLLSGLNKIWREKDAVEAMERMKKDIYVI